MSALSDFAKLAMNSPGVEETRSEGMDGRSKKSRSNDSISRGSVEAESGIWKDRSGSNHAGFADGERGSDTA